MNATLLMKSTAMALCFSTAACSSLPAPKSEPVSEPVTKTAPECGKSATAAFSGSATQAALNAVGKKLNVSGLGRTAGRSVESTLTPPCPARSAP